MSRKRLPSITGFYHVMSRGNNRVEILKKKVDKRKFLKALEESLEHSEIHIHAYCIMNNHYHMLLEAPSLEDLGNVMQRINSYYAHYYKIKYGHEGHVFQDRFLSKPLNSMGYIGNVLRYIHLNPIKAEIVSDIKEYEFSSFREYGCCKGNKIIRDGGKCTFGILGFNGIKDFRQYHLEKAVIGREVMEEILFDVEEYRYEQHLVVRELEINKVIMMRNKIRRYCKLPLRQRQDFAQIILNSTTTLSKREISKIAMVGRNRLGKWVPPGRS